MNYRVGWLASAVLPCVALTACDGGSSPTSPAPVTDVLLQGSLPDVQVLAFYPVGTFTTSVAGRLEVTVDWTFATNDLDVYVARGACTVDQVNQKTCNFASFSESRT